jgi:hypothetical protein
MMNWKDIEAVEAYIKLLFQKLPGGTEEKQEDINRDSQPLDRDFNSGPPKYEVRLLTTTLLTPITHFQ